MSHPALRPKWLLGHLIALAAVLLFVSLGFWQLRRLDETQQANSAIEAMLDRGVVPVDEAEGLPWEIVNASGEYHESDQVLIRSRSQNSISGFHVVTPFEYEPGKVLLVNRGFVPLTVGERSLAQDAPVPTGSVEIVGQLRATQVRGSIGARDPAEGLLSVLSRVDIDRIAQQIDAEVFDLWLQLTEQTPEQDLLPEYIPAPQLDDGPHLTYAMQWFFFTLVVGVGYPIILRRTFFGLNSITQS